VAPLVAEDVAESGPIAAQHDQGREAIAGQAFEGGDADRGIDEGLVDHSIPT
jgi:hypothetical protein